MHNFLVCAYKSQDFAQNLKNVAQSHDGMTVTFRTESFNCREEARKRAENDAISIRSYVDDVRSIVWGLR